MLPSLIGAIIGGLFVLVGGWLALNWQAERQARNVASAILAELSVSEEMLEKESVAEFYRELLHQWKETGTIRDRQSIVDLFDSNPQESMPVYYSMAPSLGLLPRGLAADIVQYHARIIGLQKTVLRLARRTDLDKETMKVLGQSLELQFDKTTALRQRLIAELPAFAEKPVDLIPLGRPRQAA